MKKIIFGTIFSVFALALVVVPAFAATETVYNALPNVSSPTNYASLGYQATSTKEFGDNIHLTGTARVLNTVTVTMSNWALHSDYAADSRYPGNSSTWTHPITINIYSDHLGTNGAPDTLLVTKTQNVVIPWRPEADPTCSGGTAWRSSSDNLCYNGIAFNTTFDLSSSNVTLPDNIIVGVAFNTNTWGYNPIELSGPYESLNVAVPSGQTASIGADDNSDNVFWNTSYAPFYTDGGSAGVGIFREDTNWTPYGTVALQVTANLATPISMEQCKKDGWKTFTSPTFKNQGQCVSYVQANVHAGKKTISF